MVQQESGGSTERCIEKFHIHAASGLIRDGLLRIYEMKFCQKSIAIYYALALKSRVYAYLGGFDPSMQQYSPVHYCFITWSKIQKRSREF